jgi:hypothetical protein
MISHLLRAPPHVVVRQRSHHRATMHAEVRPYHDRPSNRTCFYGLDVAPFHGPTNEFLKTPAGTGWMSSQQDPEFLGYLKMEQHPENCIRHGPFQVVDESGGQDQRSGRRWRRWEIRHPVSGGDLTSPG